MPTYRCPVCKKPITKQEYEEALGILKERDKHAAHQVAELARKVREAQARIREARKEGMEKEQARTRRLLEGKQQEIQRLKERIAQLRRGSTPQTEGLEFEDKLARRLQKEFRDDKVEHKGKGGDVLYTVRSDGKVAGLTIFECKRTPRIEPKHIRQARVAKQQRGAEFAVLVTSARGDGLAVWLSDLASSSTH